MPDRTTFPEDEYRRLVNRDGVCISCGFLSVRDRRGELIEASEAYRRDGRHDAETVDASMQLPLCTARKAEFVQEIREYLRRTKLVKDNEVEGRAHRPHDDAVRGVVWKDDRNCQRKDDGWVRWSPGFTPKEHREKLDLEAILEAERRSRRVDFRFRFLEVLAFILAGFITSLTAALVERGTLFGGDEDPGRPQQVVIVTEVPATATPSPVPPTPTPDIGADAHQSAP
jgi:hypothetical protein